MWTEATPAHLLFFYILFLSSGTYFSSVNAQQVPRVFSITPREGGSNGGTLITIKGVNFAETLFTLDKHSKIGNVVTLTNLKAYGCDIHPDGSDKNKITCFTTPMPEGEYEIKVSVDGVDVPDENICSSCKFRVRSARTPTITQLEPRSGVPGEVIKISGNIMTDKYGSNVPDSESAKILRVYFGRQKCELQKSLDELYGLEYTSGKGHIMCKPEGTFIGNPYISYLISNGYGRSEEIGWTKYPRSNGISMYQTFTEIENLSTKKGSKAGATEIAITGKHFDETDKKAKVEIGGVGCDISGKVNDTTILCTTPADPTEGKTHFTGGRGFHAYVHPAIIDASTINKATTPMEYVDSSEWKGFNRSDHTVLMTGYFLPLTTGTYSFCIHRAASRTKLYVSPNGDPANKTLVSDGTATCSKTLTPYHLKKGQRCYMEVHYSSNQLNSYFTTSVHLKETDYTGVDTAWALHEKQKFTISGRTDPEVQELEVASPGNYTLTPDVQEITINGSESSTFVIGLNDIFTTEFSLATLTGSALKKELEKLPSIVGTLSVEVTGSSNAKVISITSSFEHGIVGDYEVKIITGAPNSLTFANKRRTVGSGSATHFALTINGTATTPLKIGASASQVKSALLNLFSIQCHPKLKEGTVEKFEVRQHWMSTIESDTEPFCDRYSVKNPGYLFREDPQKKTRLSASSNRYVCFAYKGHGDLSRLYLRYENYDEEGEKTLKTANMYIQNPHKNPDKWNYWCEDIYNFVRSKASGVYQTIVWIRAVKVDNSKDLYMDQFAFRKNMPMSSDSINKGLYLMWRKPQVLPKGYFIKSVDVTKSGNKYQITMKPHRCGHNFNLIKTQHGNVTKVKNASPPIVGTYKISFKNDSTDDIPVTAVADSNGVRAQLAATKMGYSEVKGSGTCSSFNYEIHMISQTGDQPEIQLDIGKLSGDSVSSSIQVTQNGGLWHSPIMGDLLRTHHNKPQVIAFINGIPTRCASKNACDYEWSADSTPTVSGVTPNQGSNGNIITVAGSNFGDSNKVMFGKTPCDVTAARPTSLVCTVGNGPIGPAPVKVFVEGKGLASGNVKFTFVSNVTSFPSLSGSYEGGRLLEFSGLGFTPDAIVLVGGKVCTIVNITESYVKCITPRAATLSTTTVPVNITQSGSESNLGSFTYSNAFTPVITSINESFSSILGGGIIAITGTGFGTVEMPVTMGGVRLNVSSYTDMKIIAVLPALPHGTYKVLVNVEGKGYADLRKNSIADITYMFVVNGMYPTVGSMYGGTDLSIIGSGFQKALLDVHVGPHECKVTSADHNNIKCRIMSTGVHHHIFANGTHKSYGIGYAWNKDPYTVSVGDTITWHWETPYFIKDMSYAVRQTAKASDLTDMPGGFSSGKKTRKGSYSHTFTKTGTYYYWTNYMDSAGVIYFRGTIHVVPLESSVHALSVKMHKFEASYKAEAMQTPVYTCSATDSNVTGCVDEFELKAMPGVFNFNMSKCSSPYLKSQSLTSGSFNDIITIEGNGFGAKNCQNVITYGKAQKDQIGCTEIISSSPNSISFKISPSCQPPIGELHQFSVQVHNLGYALMSLPHSSSNFGLLPIVESIQPLTGSKVGGTKLTITGAGFSGEIDKVLVEFMKLSCEIESMNYTQIVCTTKCAAAPSNCHAESMPFTVEVGRMKAKCDPSVCRFNTTEEDTPVVTVVTPNNVSSGANTLELHGSKFSPNTKVMIGGTDCVVTPVNSTYFTCVVGWLPVGDNDVSVYVPPLGKAATTQVVKSEKIANILSPTESSIHGGAVMTIGGNGFVDGKTEVKVNGANCSIQSVGLPKVKCTLPPQAAGEHRVVITSNGVTYDSLSLNYTSEATPVVKSITPNTGGHNDVLTIAGQGFGAGSKIVKIGGVECNVSSSTPTMITCKAGVQETGKFPVQVYVPGLGLSNNNVKFTYELSPFTVNPTQGSTTGGQKVTLSGSGFLAGETTVKICGKVCKEVSATASSYVCRTAAHEAGPCDVEAEVRGVKSSKAAAYTYNSALASTVTGVSPKRGGTGGGTLLTITGTKFGISKGDIFVTIAGSTCVLVTLIDTKITCRTGNYSHAVITEVEVYKPDSGVAEKVNAGFEYIDVWSSPFTWGGMAPPGKGVLAQIPKGKKVLLDMNTPVLKMLLIQGGHLVFDEKDIELQAESILITDGGILEIGTEAKPFENKAIITMHGHVRSTELPVYGAKGIGLREGRLEFHGRHIPVPWTHLSATAAAGHDTINLVKAVNWNVGDEIVIATTGDRLSQGESEVKKIKSISADKKQLSLTEPLKYEHISKTATFGTRTVEFRAEVGLLTRNVLIRGNRNVEFDHKIEACPDVFKPGQFDVQSCFQGRFGEEMGSDQYGVQILIHQQEKDTQVAQAHIENTEITHAGQAFRLGRYPVHFHLNGNMNESYVRRCAIHHTFNRAVNIHGSHNTMVEHNVVYNAMGGALFLEDGIETGNTFQYNLEVFVKSSTSLLNDDITPAAIWITNPFNFVRHNTAAGGTHFGAWYRMHHFPDGPSYTTKICPQNMPLGEYSNNTAHSLGWFGLWIFETYIPKDSHVCSGSAPHKVAKFESLTAWNNEEGAESVNTGAIQFRDFVVVNNEKSGIHFSLIKGNPPQYDDENGPGLFNSIIVARHDGLRGKSSAAGIVQPHYNGFMVKDVEFYNFDEKRSNCFIWVTIAGVCTNQCGGFTTKVSGLKFDNSPNKIRFAWENEGIIHDMDGSLTGEAGASAVACSGSHDQSKCKKDAEFSKGVEGCICSKDVKLFRFAFNDINPQSLLYKTAHFTSKHGTTNGPWREKRVSHTKGWQVVLQANLSYDFTFENAEQAVNISYSGTTYQLTNGDYFILTQKAYQMPDIFRLDGRTNLPISSGVPSGNEVAHGDWFYNNSEITYAIKNDVGDEKNIKMQATRCFWRGCEKPASPMSIIKEPANAEKTSIPATWKNLTVHGGPPKPMDDLYIAYERWIVVDTVLPKLGKVVIEGGLQFKDDFLKENLLEADYIYIKGRLVAGWSEEKPFNGKLTIRLRGKHSTPNYPVKDGANLGSKFIAVFGGLQLHGIDRGITKTFLASEASPGTKTITLKDAVNWKAGEEILITTSDYNAWHTEIFKITQVSGKTLTLNGTIKHRHISHEESIDGKVLDLSARVALLSRNIRIEGEEYDKLVSESFGSRILVGQSFSNSKLYSGFAQVSNVEFFHAGQEGFKSSSDARYALTYLGVTSTKGKVRYSYAKHNTFHNGFSTAIGVFSTEGLEIEDNTIHHTVGPGIHIEAIGTKVVNNLVTLSIWPGSYLDRKETENYDFTGGIEARKATKLVLVNNTVAGSERNAYGLPGQACTTASGDLWSGNMGSGAQSGLAMFTADTTADSKCVQFSGFIMWKNFDYGIYYMHGPSLVIKDNIFVENSVAVTPFVVGPGSTGHSYADKSIKFEDNVFIGKTSSFSESLDVMPSGDNIKYSSQARGQHSSAICGKAGIMIGSFTSGSNMSPRKPWLNVMSYQAIKGITIVEGNHFMNYGKCTGGQDHAIVTNKDNDDAIHPVTMSNSRLTNVNKLSKILFHVPNVGKVNPSDCVDMDCDAHKKCLVEDTDGTYLGLKGTVLPEAAYQWDGKDKRHGLGDYRIPMVMKTTPDGKKRDPSVFAPKKGLYKIDECKWIPEWVAYECHNGLHWKMLVVESMDKDTELRRISPVAVYHKDGYIDLVNGPQDHGWCTGYTCQKRLSTFPVLVALGQPFELYLTGSNPDKMRYMLLNSESKDCVRLSMYHTKTNRLEVRVDGKYIKPNNGFYDKNGKYRIKLETTKGEFMPAASSKTIGENYMSQEDQTITWIQCGGSEVLITRLDAVLVSFTLPEMTVDEFFGDNLVQNLASFLNIDPKKVRIVNIVRSDGAKRKRRSTGRSTVYIEISDTPDETPSTDVTKISDEIIKLVQFGSPSKVLKTEVLYTSIVEPDADSSDPVVLQKPGQLVLDTPPEGLVAEDVPLKVQPKLKVVDDKGNVVTHLGSKTLIWEIEATIKSGGIARAQIVGTTRMNFTEGWANFTDLAINDKGADYIIEFKIVYPTEATKYSISSAKLAIFGKQFRPKATLLTNKRITNKPIEMEVGLVDKVTNLDFTNIGWDNYTWGAEIGIYDKNVYSGALLGDTKINFDVRTGTGKFSFALDTPGTCPLLVTIKSVPAGYELKMVVNVDLITPDQNSFVVQKSGDIELKFPITYDPVRAPFWASQVANAYSKIPGLKITKVMHRAGSTFILLTVEASNSGFNATLFTICNDIETGRNFTFDGTSVAMSHVMNIDGKPYYGVSCGETGKGKSNDDDDKALHMKYIIIIAVLAFLVILLIIIVLYKCCVQPKAKTDVLTTTDVKPVSSNYSNNKDLLADVLLREETSSSLKSWTNNSRAAPAATSLPQYPFDLQVKSPDGTTRRTPSPAWTK